MTVGESQLVKADGSADPFPCSGTLPDCTGEHDGSVVVEGPAAVNTAAPLVCDVETGECLAIICGVVMTFGWNGYGQLGDDTMTDRHSPIELTAVGSDNVQLAAGDDYSLVLKSDGRVMAFGRNSLGALGDGTTTDRHSPIEVASLGRDNAQVVAGGRHSFVVKLDGRVMAFGSNNKGQLGDGTTTNRQSPVEVASLGNDNAQLSCGDDDYSMVLKADGRVMVFGRNENGQLGDGTKTDRHSPVEVASLGSDNVQVATGGGHSLVLKSDGRVTVFGLNNRCQLGVGDGYSSSASASATSPIELSTLGSDNVQLAAGNQHSLALKADGRVIAFGNNLQGQMGDGYTGIARTDRYNCRVEVTALGNENVQVAAGGDHSLVLKADGRWVGFGENNNGQLGDGTTTDRHSPVELMALGADNALLTAGKGHALVLKSP